MIKDILHHKLSSILLVMLETIVQLPEIQTFVELYQLEKGPNMLNNVIKAMDYGWEPIISVVTSGLSHTTPYELLRVTHQ